MFRIFASFSSVVYPLHVYRRVPLIRYGASAALRNQLATTSSTNNIALSSSSLIGEAGDHALSQVIGYIQQAAPSNEPVQVSRLARMLPDDLLDELPGGVLKFCRAHPSVLEVIDVSGVAFVKVGVKQQSAPVSLLSIPPPPPCPPQDQSAPSRRRKDDDLHRHTENIVVLREAEVPKSKMISLSREIGPQKMVYMQRLPSKLVSLDELVAKETEDKAQVPQDAAASPQRHFWDNVVLKAGPHVCAVAVPRAQLDEYYSKIQAFEEEEKAEVEEEKKGDDGTGIVAAEFSIPPPPQPLCTEAAEGVSASSFSEDYDIVVSPSEARAFAQLDETFALDVIDDIGIISAQFSSLCIFVSLHPEFAALGSFFSVDEACRKRGLFANDYDAFRVARFLSLSRATPLLHVAHRVRHVISSIKALPLVLLSFPQLFATDSPNRISAVRFLLNDVYIPPLSRSQSAEELREKAMAFREQWKALPARDNQLRVKLKVAEEIHRRAMHIQLRPSVCCDTNVLAYFLFDLLGDQPVNTGLFPELLPQHIRDVTNSKSKKFIKSFPHLFRMLEDPPNYLVQRADLPATEAVDPNCSDDEVNQIVLSIVTSRLQAHKSKILLPSHVQKYVPKVIRDRMNESDGSFEKFLRNRPKMFTLTDGVHAKEPVISLPA